MFPRENPPTKTIQIPHEQGRSQGGSRGSRGSPPPPSLVERFSKDDTTPLTTPKRGKNDVEMP